jgi:MFS family permease
MSFITVSMSIASLLVPLIGGFITQYFGITGLTILSVIFVFFSILPILRLENHHYIISRRLLDFISTPHIKKAIKLNFVNEFQSREKFWELYVFIYFAGNYANMGVFMTLIAIMVVPLNFLLGQYLDHHNRKFILKFTSLFASLVWLGKMVATTIAQFTAIDIVHKLNSSLKNQIIDTLNTNYLMEEGQVLLLDERIAVREITQNFFIGSNLLLGILLLTVFGFPAVFLQASIAALFFYLL